LQPLRDEPVVAQEVKMVATARAIATKTIVFLIFVVFIDYELNCLVRKMEFGPGNSKDQEYGL
jgi:hypothetical protein